MENTEALKLINQGFEWEANYQKVIFQIICRGLSVDESLQMVKSLEHFQSLYETIPRKNRYSFMKKAKFRVMEIMEEDLNKGLIKEGEYLSGCNTLRKIYT